MDAPFAFACKLRFEALWHPYHAYPARCTSIIMILWCPLAVLVLDWPALIELRLLVESKILSSSLLAE